MKETNKAITVVNPSGTTGSAPSSSRGPLIVLLAAVAAVALLLNGLPDAANDAEPEVEPIAVPVAAPDLARTETPPAPVEIGSDFRGPILGEQTDVVFVFDDGLDGLLVIDPDGRTATRHTAGILRISRQMQLRDLGESLVIGAGRTIVLEAATGTELAAMDAVYHLVAPDKTLWLVESDSSDGSVYPLALVTQVDLAGQIIIEPTLALEHGRPIAAVSDGLVMTSVEGLFVWNPVSGQRTNISDDGRAIGLGASGDMFVWCAADCRGIETIDLATGATTSTALPAELGIIDNSTFAWSPDGDAAAFVTTEAVVVASGIGTTPAAKLSVMTFYAMGAGAPRYIAWDGAGEYLYFATDSPSGRLTGMWRSDGTAAGTVTTTLPFGGVNGSFLVLDAATADWLLEEPQGTVVICEAPVVDPRMEPHVCAFRF